MLGIDESMKLFKTWADAGTLKVKYLVNAKNFKHILQPDGLIFYKYYDCRLILKARAFK